MKLSDWVRAGNRYLTMEEMTQNAQYVLDYMTQKGWSKNAVCGMLGNMQTESNINPQLWESLQEGNLQGGFGLVQWTPASIVINWCNANGKDYNNMDSQLEKIISEVTDGSQWISSEMTFQEFTVSTQPASDLALLFIKAYERPLDPNQPIRGTQATNWFNTLTGGGTPTPSGDGNCKLLYPYTYGTFNKISYKTNSFQIVKKLGNTLIIKESGSNRSYRVHKSYVKIL